MSETTTPAGAVPTTEECRELWGKFDYNNNGLLSLAELDKSVMELWPTLDHKPAIMRAYKTADKNEDGFIRKNEFRYFLTLIHYYNKCWSIFDGLDADDDKDRRLDAEEFRKVAGVLDISDPDAVFAQMDVNEGGFVLFDEFCSWMAKNFEATKE